MSRLWRWVLWTVVGVVPGILFVLLQTGVIGDPHWVVPYFHFFIVSLTSLVALLLAVLMVLAAGQLRDARIIFLSLAFLAIAGIFSVHGLTTPGALFAGMNPWVAFSSQLSLFAGAIFFALSTIDRRPGFQRFVIARQKAITGAFAALMLVYGAIAMADAARGGVMQGTGNAASSTAASSSGYGSYGSHSHAASPSSSQVASGGMPDLGPFGFLANDIVIYLVAGLTLLLFAQVIVHYVSVYRASFASPSVTGFLVSAVLLFQAQVMMRLGDLWYASWWEYHVLMLFAFVAAVVGLVLEYSQSGSLQGVVEGLFVRDTITQLQRGYTEVIVALVAAVEAKDRYTHGHTQRVTELSLLIGEELRLPPERMRVLSQAAMLHDIGKIGVPDAILNKPGKLTDDEFAIVKEHPVRGYEIIRRVRSLQAVLGGIRHHHEKLDGTGYPDGLRGDEIPIEARIIAVADVFDALTSERSYRAAWPVDKAMEVIDAEEGAGLDPSCVAALRSLLASPERLRRLRTDSEPGSATLSEDLDTRLEQPEISQPLVLAGR